MTFWQAIKTGYRFRLPKGRGGKLRWKPAFYWRYEKNTNIMYVGLDGIPKVDLDVPLDSFLLIPFTQKMLAYKDFYLHPEDMEKYLFDLKMERISTE